MSENIRKVRISPLKIKGLQREYRNIIAKISVNPYVLRMDSIDEIAITDYLLDNTYHIDNIMKQCKNKDLLMPNESLSKDDSINFDIMVLKNGGKNVYDLIFGISSANKKILRKNR